MLCPLLGRELASMRMNRERVRCSFGYVLVKRTAGKSRKSNIFNAHIGNAANMGVIRHPLAALLRTH